MIRNRRWLYAFSTALLPTMLAGTSLAQGRSDPAAARALFSEARQLMAEKKYDQACPKFEESQRLDPGIGTLFNLADCWDRTGKTASAWARFLDVASAARSAGQADRERVARDRASKLEPKLSKLIVQVQSPVTGQRVSKDGSEVGPAEIGTAVPVDPGDHLVESTATGKKPWSSTVTVAPGGAKATVTIPPLEDQPVVVVAPTRATPLVEPLNSTGMGLGRDRAESSSSGTAQRVVGVVVGVLGLGGIGVGIGFNSIRAKNTKDAGALCHLHDPVSNTNNNCGSAQEAADHDSFNNKAKNARVVELVGFAAGGVAVVTGLVLVLTAPRSSSSASLHLVPVAGTTEAGVALAGTW